MAENGINKRKKARKSSSPTKAALGVPGEFDTPQPARGQPAPRRPRRAVAARATAHAVEAAAQGQEEAPQGLRPRRHINKPKRLCEEDMTGQAELAKPARRAARKGPAGARRATTNVLQEGVVAQAQMVPQQTLIWVDGLKMPLKPGGPCYECKCTWSPVWRKGYEKGLYPQETFCNACGTRDRREGLEADKQDQQVMGDDAADGNKYAIHNVAMRSEGRAAANRANQQGTGQDRAAAVILGKGKAVSRGAGRGEAQSAALEQEQEASYQEQGCEPAETTEGPSPDSPAAKAKGKRVAASLSSDGKHDGRPGPSKVFRLHAFGGESAHAAGAQQLANHHAARSLFQEGHNGGAGGQKSNDSGLTGSQDVAEGSHNAAKGMQLGVKGSSDAAKGDLLCEEGLDMESPEESEAAAAAASALMGMTHRRTVRVKRDGKGLVAMES